MFNGWTFFSNFFSFGEMPTDVLCGYLRSSPYKKCKTFAYLVNRVVSSPTFEHVYDNNTNDDFDYCLKRENIDYFDLFPVHNYNIFERKLFWPQSTQETTVPIILKLF